jgi:very-short-patch-repair endonuclease
VAVAYPSSRRATTISVMDDGVRRLLDATGGVATSGDLLNVLSRSQLDIAINRGDLIKVWTGVYTDREVDTLIRLRGLDLRAGTPVASCLGTAAAAYGFNTECDDDLHVLTPPRHLLRDSDGLKVHRRNGAPLVVVDGRRMTAPAWTAVEVACGLRRPRALATLDAALRSGSCDRQGLQMAAVEQFGRRGIIHVRELIVLAAAEAESPMESEARLVMFDHGLRTPELQFEIVDRSGRTWRVDFAWPDSRLAVEYEGFDFHSSPDDLRRDRQKRVALAELGWTVMGIVGDDVRRRPYEMSRSIAFALDRPAAA